MNAIAVTNNKIESPGKKNRPIISLGYQSESGEIITTDVLCINFPPITDDEMAVISREMTRWASLLRTKL